MSLTRRHPLLLLILGLMLATRALLPSGWMPVAHADGVRIVLCTPQGTVVARLDAQGNLHQGEPDEPAPRGDSCPFGTLAQAADVPAAVELAAPPLQAALPPAARLSSDPQTPLHRLRPPATGPPAFA